MSLSCWLLGFVVMAYLWHAGLLTLEASGKYLEERPRTRRAVFAVGALFLLAPAAYHALEFAGRVTLSTA